MGRHPSQTNQSLSLEMSTCWANAKDTSRTLTISNQQTKYQLLILWQRYGKLGPKL